MNKRTLPLVLIALMGAMTIRHTSAQESEPMAKPTENETLEARCEREVVELHQFFRDWVNADIENTGEVFKRFAGVMAPGFHIVSPDSSVLDRATILSIVRDGYSGATGGGKMRIWIEHFEVRAVVGDVVIVSYEEWQEIAGQPRGRISSGVFRAREETPNGVEWLHLHETWLPAR